MGEKSFGKGTIQEAQDLPHGTGAHITVAKWLTPNGRWVNEAQGLEPDVLVAVPKEQNGQVDEEKDLPAGRQDIQLDKALELLE